MTFLSFGAPKVAKVIRCFGVTFGTFFGDFLHSGWIVKMELSLGRELNLEGWRGSELTRISVFFEDVFQNLKKSALDVIFYVFSAKRDPKGYPRASQIHQKSSKNDVQNSLGFPLAARSLPEGVQGSKRLPKVIENPWFVGVFL